MVFTNIYSEINLKSTYELNLIFYENFIINKTITIWLGVCGKTRPINYGRVG